VKVIVTGSSGRVGRAVRAALGVHHEVLGVDVSPSSSTDVVASIEDRVVLERVLGGADAVVHAAGLHAPHVGRVPDSRFWEVNVTATRLLAGLCVQVGVPRLIFTSTTALYGRASTRADAASWVTEETPPSPRTIYHRTKLSAEAVLRDASRAGELDVKWSSVWHVVSRNRRRSWPFSACTEESTSAMSPSCTSLPSWRRPEVFASSSARVARRSCRQTWWTCASTPVPSSVGVLLTSPRPSTQGAGRCLEASIGCTSLTAPAASSDGPRGSGRTRSWLSWIADHHKFSRRLLRLSRSLLPVRRTL